LLGTASVIVPAAQSSAPNRTGTYVWWAELVGVDTSAKTVTAKAPVQAPVTSYVTTFKAGEKLMLTWIANAGTREAGPILYIEKYEVTKASNLTTGYILPVEFVAADAAAKTITFKAALSDDTIQPFTSIRPGQWMKVTSPMLQPADTALVLAVERVSGPEAFVRVAPPTALAADPVTTVASVAEFSRAMKAIGAAFGAATQAIPSKSFDEAQAQLAVGISTMKAVAKFWETRQKEDPTRLANDALTKMQQLNEMIGGNLYNVNVTAVDTATKAVGGACGACHAKYRDQDPATKVYAIRAGTL
jgi:hypothetical protein